MTAALRSDRRRSIVTLAVWSVGFLAVIALAAWQFGWLPTDDAAHTPPADSTVELTGGSTMPFDTNGAAADGAEPGENGTSTAQVDPAIFEQQTEPEPEPNPTNEMTQRDDRRGRLWDHVREAPAAGNASPPPDAAPRYSTAATPAGWLTDDRADGSGSAPPGSAAAAPARPAQSGATGGVARRAPGYGQPAYGQAGYGQTGYGQSADVGSTYQAVPPQAGRNGHASAQPPWNGAPVGTVAAGAQPPGEYAAGGPYEARLPQATAPTLDSHVRLVGVEDVDTTGPEAVTADGRAGLEIDPSHPAARDLVDIDRMVAGGQTEDIKEAHRRLSTMYWKQPDWRPMLYKRIDQTAESIYFSNLRHYMEPYMVQPGDQLSRIAAQYKVSWQYLERLNGVQATRIRPGQRLKVIKGPFAARVDLSDHELTIHAHGWYVARYRIGIGRDGSTPLGKFTVQEKLVNPTYYRPPAEGGGIVAADDPQNPLGEYWIGIGDGYGIHGTIDPQSIGGAESRGCLRLLNEDIAAVYGFLVPGSEVVIQP